MDAAVENEYFVRENCFTLSNPHLPIGFELRIREVRKLRTEDSMTFLVTAYLGPRSSPDNLRRVSALVTVPIPLGGPMSVKSIPNPFRHLKAEDYIVRVKGPHRIEYSHVTNRPNHTNGVQAQEGTFLALKRLGHICCKPFVESVLLLAGNSKIENPSDMYSSGKGWLSLNFQFWLRTASATVKQVNYVIINPLMQRHIHNSLKT